MNGTEDQSLLSQEDRRLISDIALLFSLDPSELQQNSLASSRNRNTHESRTTQNSSLSCQPLKSVNMLREAEWFSKTKREAASVLEDLDPESLTRCLTKGISTTGTSNPGWRLDTQGYVSYLSLVVPDLKRSSNESHRLRSTSLRASTSSCSRIVTERSLARTEGARPAKPKCTAPRLRASSSQRPSRRSTRLM